MYYIRVLFVIYVLEIINLILILFKSINKSRNMWVMLERIVDYYIKDLCGFGDIFVKV